MEGQVELEICANCKREIPHYNYVMHTAHCARNISLCAVCKEPVPKAQIEEHKKTCGAAKKKIVNEPPPPVAKIEHSKYFQQQRAIEDSKAAQRQEKRLQRMERLADAGETLGRSTSNTSGAEKNDAKAAPSLLPCQYCELELPKLDLIDHETYCGARTEKCTDCGELVMFKYRQLHQDTNHGFLKLTDEPGPRRTSTAATFLPDSPTRRRFSPFRSFSTLDAYMPPGYPFATSFSTSSVPLAAGTPTANGEKPETSREISRRLDCKTEYIRNLLHDSASITAPIRQTGAVPRHLRHNKGPAPQPPPLRRRNPPTELVIPCEFCGTPVPHEELIEHETGCRPDLAKYNPRRRGSSPDYYRPIEPSSPDVDIPCEYCSDLIPASQFLSHQATCSCN